MDKRYFGAQKIVDGNERVLAQLITEQDEEDIKELRYKMRGMLTVNPKQTVVNQLDLDQKQRMKYGCFEKLLKRKLGENKGKLKFKERESVTKFFLSSAKEFSENRVKVIQQSADRSPVRPQTAGFRDFFMTVVKDKSGRLGS
jgi:hypothetical protein